MPLFAGFRKLTGEEQGIFASTRERDCLLLSSGHGATEEDSPAPKLPGELGLADQAYPGFECSGRAEPTSQGIRRTPLNGTKDRQSFARHADFH